MRKRLHNPTSRGPDNHALLLVEDLREAELYISYIGEVATCSVDTISRFEEYYDKIDQAKYQLMVISISGSEISLLETIRRTSPDTSVIVISGNATVEQAVTAIRLGAEDFLSKPVKRDPFCLAVRRGLDKESVFGTSGDASDFLHLFNSCQLISSSLDQGKIFEAVHSYLSRELNSQYAAIYSLHGNDPIRVDHFVGSGDNETLGETLDISLRTTNPLLSLSQSPEYFRLHDDFFVFKFSCAGPSDYYFVSLSPQSPALVAGFENRLKLLKAQIEATGKNIEQYMGIQQLVYVDDATGLFNTRYLNYILDREISFAQITRKPFAVLFIDIDQFKRVNDVHGHLIGTQVLKELGSQLKKTVRKKDLVFRYGGDEFVALLSQSDSKTALAVAERIRSNIESRKFLKGSEIQVTVSIGLALFPEHADNKKAILEMADRAMYEAKKTMRNCVFLAKADVVSGGPVARR